MATVALSGIITPTNVVTATSTSTLTNKTLTSPIITGTGAIAAASVTASTTLGVTGVSTLTGGAVIEGLTVGRGASAVSTNTAVGVSALAGITTAGNITAVGYQAGYTNTTAGQSTYIGTAAGTLATGSGNTFVGCSSGESITTGSSNTILGRYNGNFGGLDIRTASNYIVLSDGAGTPLISTNSSSSVALNGAVPQTGTGITFPETQSASSNPQTLDDYEEGTWSPGITSSSGTLTAHTSTGTYTKIGRTVTVTFSSTITTPGSASGTMNISAFPFTNGNAYQVPTVCREQANVGTAYQAVLGNSATTGFVRSFTEGSISWTAGNQYVFFMTYVV